MADPGIKASDINLEDTSKTKDELILENERLQKKAKNVARIALLLGVIALAILAVLVGVLINYSISDDSNDNKKERSCGSLPAGQRQNRNLLGEPEQPGIFHDVTVAEIRRVRQYLEREIGLAKPEAATLRDPHIYTIDLQPPNKTEALAYLDGQADPPDRYARVTLFRGDLDPPVVEERLCAPLNNVSSCEVDVTIPFARRPMESREYYLYDKHLTKEIQRMFGTILRDSYGGSLNFDECEDDCLNYYPLPVTINRYGNDGKRRIWFQVMYDVTYVTLHVLDFACLCDIDGVDETKFSVEKVWYSGTLYSSPQELLDAWNNGTAHRTNVTYPSSDDALIGTFKHRGPYKPNLPQRPPELIEPDGKRYTVRHKKVEYLDMWSFYYRMSTTHGPALYDIRFMGERIAYEISLAELGIFYSGYDPTTRLMYADTIFLIGSRSKALVAGADCPSSATFLPLTVTSQGKEEPAVFAQAICIFEQNLGTPLRRHHSYGQDGGAFYGGMLDSALIVRSIQTVDNYDYVIDFMFHQNGAMGASAGLTGYLFGGLYTEEERPYGFKLTDQIFGPIHVHLANFKVDVDIKGTSNRYETLNIEEESLSYRQATNPQRTGMKFFSTTKTTETEAAYKYDFDSPMYHIFYNNDMMNKYGEKRAFRLSSSGIAKQLLRENVGDEGITPWARYQLAVTQRKESESKSSSPYSQWGPTGNLVNFQDFIDDNDNIVDEDLVAWVTLGVHHIPHTEDLPVVSTSGRHLSFHLSPYNYFTECPSMMSRDAVYVEHADQDEPEKGLVFDYHGTGDVHGSEEDDDDEKGSCLYEPLDTSAIWRKNPDALLETTEHNGVL